MIISGGFMKAKRVRFAAAIAALAALGMTPVAAQQRAPTPDQRIERLEQQLRQVQRQVFPRGQPADTAGIANEPAATQSSVRTIDARLNGVERQLADILRQSEENGHQLTVMQADIARMKAEQEERLGALERGAAAAPAIQPSTTGALPSGPPVTPNNNAARPSSTTAAAAPAASADDAGEIAYDEGYQLWRAGKFDQAVTSLRAFSSSFPKHRRASWANNLAGRALLDKGEPRAAAEALLANYRGNPKGERAPDSLYYLGQALMQLKQSEQACKAYAELEAVYGPAMRDELKRLLPPAKADARCN
jgi:TolA-binding protein